MSGTATLTLLEAALDFARRGWPVFPLHTIIDGRCSCREDGCKSAGKHPRIAGGFTYASTVKLTIKHWWTRWPDGNIGIATGKVSRFFAVDVDPRHGGDVTLADLEREHGRLPDTVESLTGGGGRHIFFRYPGVPVKSGTGVLGPGLDVKGDGGYIVAPESLHASGRRYEWEVSSHPDDAQIAETPAWLLAMLTAKSNGNGKERRTEGDWLRLLRGVPKGQRHGVANQIAGHYLGIGRPAEEVETLILGFLSQCDPPGDAKEQEEFRQIVEDLAAKDAKKEAPTDPLALLRNLASPPDRAAVEQALRQMAANLTGTDPLKRRIIRQEAVALLTAKKVAAGAGLVDAAMALGGADAVDDQGSQPVMLTDPERWPEPVDGAELLAHLEATLQRFVILPDHAALTIALWVLHAHALKAFTLSPTLAVLSPTMRCGKTTLLHLLAALLPRALSTSNITPAALFRSLEQFKPCLLVDEGDSFLTLSEELRGILNSSHTRSGAAVIRTVGESFEPRFFSTWGPKVLAAIGKLPPTVMDRSVVIPMKRKAPGEQVERFRHNKLKDLTPLCRQAARWAADNLATLQEADPVVPEQLNDRAADNWRPLLAIADLVGGDWPHRARTAALMLSGGERDPEADGAGVMLIADCVAIFNDRGIDRLSTTDLIEELVKLEERPWPEWSKGKHITPRVLARLLKPFGIKPKVERAGNAQFRGYEAHAFDDAHSRYSQGSNVYHPYQSNENNNLYPNFKVYQTPDGTHTKSDLSIEKQMDGTHGTHKNPENGRNERDEQDFDVTTPGFETHCAADLGDLFDSEEVLL